MISLIHAPPNHAHAPLGRSLLSAVLATICIKASAVLLIAEDSIEPPSPAMLVGDDIEPFVRLWPIAVNTGRCCASNQLL